MILSNRTIFGELASSRKGKIYRAIKHKKPLFDTYFLTLPIDGPGVLEVYPYNVLLQSFYQSKKYTVIGIAYTKEEALELVNSIVSECYFRNKDLEILKYYKERNL